MTAAEIQALQPGDTIIGAFGEWEDELRIVEVLRGMDKTTLLIEVSPAMSVRYVPRANGPELRGVRV
jgi:hypothetical protein